jgi:hypothetical protein
MDCKCRSVQGEGEGVKCRNRTLVVDVCLGCHGQLKVKEKKDLDL